MAIQTEPAAAPTPELTGLEKSAVRTTVFHHLAGIVITPVAKALADRGVFALLGDAPAGVSMDEIAARTGCNRGYLRVALRLLVSCGWIAQVQEAGGTKYMLTPEGKIAVWLDRLVARD